MSFPTRSRRLMAASVSACIFGAPVVAATIDEEVVVTATRTPVALANTLASVTAITRTDLEASQPLDLADVFQKVAGLDISRNGGPGSVTSLFTRGTGSGHTLFLVDGQRVSSATLGSTSFQFLNPDQIERIEVVRGSHSALYGSEAIGGVIQVFTRDGRSSPGSYLSTDAGDNNLRKVAAGASGKRDNWRYSLHGSYLETDGIDNLEDDSGFNRDRDGYRNRSVNASVGYRFDNNADLSLRFLESDNRNEYDSAYSPDQRPYSDTRLQNINLQGRLPVTDFWLSRLSLGQSTDDIDNYDGVTGLNTGNFRTEREQLLWQNDFTLADGQIVTLGYDYYNDKVDSTSSAYVNAGGVGVSSRNNSALFTQYQGNWSYFDLVLGLRRDDNEEFGTKSTGNVAAGINIDAHHKVVASWSQGFKAPTFNDLYWPHSAYSAGNPDLEPEESDNTEIGIRGNYDHWAWALAYFENDVDNLIDWSPGPDYIWRPYNVHSADISGGEFSLNTNLADWRIDASYTYVEPRDGDTDKLLIKRSRSNLAVKADRDFGNLRLGLDLKAQDKRYADAANTRSLGGYTTVGLRLGYQVTRHLETRFKVDNLFDKDYRLSQGYNQQGRYWQLGLTYRL